VFETAHTTKKRDVKCWQLTTAPIPNELLTIGAKVTTTDTIYSTRPTLYRQLTSPETVASDELQRSSEESTQWNLVRCRRLTIFLESPEPSGKLTLFQRFLTFSDSGTT